MGVNFNKDFERTKLFYEKNKEIIQNVFKEGSKIYNVEFDNSEIANLIDTYCGIDYILLSNKKVIGVAARINFNSSHHNHVTIRYKRVTGAKTEFEKRVHSIKNNVGEIYASITMQIDADNDEIIRLIIFESDKLYLTIFANLEYYENNYMMVNHFDNNKFFKISYEELQQIAKLNNFKVYVKQIRGSK